MDSLQGSGQAGGRLLVWSATYEGARRFAIAPEMPLASVGADRMVCQRKPLEVLDRGTPLGTASSPRFRALKNQKVSPDFTNRDPDRSRRVRAPSSELQTDG
jgi:hypothetical protein